MTSSRAARPILVIRCHSGVSRYHRAHACASAAAWSSSRPTSGRSGGSGGPVLAAGAGRSRTCRRSAKAARMSLKSPTRRRRWARPGLRQAAGWQAAGLGGRGGRAGGVAGWRGRQVEGVAQEGERGADVGEVSAVGAGVAAAARRRSMIAASTRSSSCSSRLRRGLAAGPGLAGRVRPGCGLLRGAAGWRPGRIRQRAQFAPVVARWLVLVAWCPPAWCGARRVAGALTRLGPGGAVVPVPVVPAGPACGRWRGGRRLPVRGGGLRAVAGAVVLGAGVIPASVGLRGGSPAEERAERPGRGRDQADDRVRARPGAG